MVTFSPLRNLLGPWTSDDDLMMLVMVKRMMMMIMGMILRVPMMVITWFVDKRAKTIPASLLWCISNLRQRRREQIDAVESEGNRKIATQGLCLEQVVIS